MHYRHLVNCILCLSLLACGGGGGSNSGNIGDSGGGDNGGGTNPPPVTNAASTVLAFNDLGMHCMDREFSVFSILPPFNVVHSQVVLRDADGRPYLADDVDVEVFYDAVADPSGSRNSYSAGVAKTDFWLYANSLFGVNLTAGEGLTGLYMPADDPLNRGAQPMDYSAPAGWFSAEGIPITPVDDNLITNTYPLLQIAAHDKTSGSKIGSLDVVVPVATETDCQACHATGTIAAQGPGPGTGWANLPDKEVESKLNILKLHDDENQTSLENSQPVLCAQCHYSPALDLAGTGPAGDQLDKPLFSVVMHEYHGNLGVFQRANYGGNELLPVPPRQHHPMPARGHGHRRDGLLRLPRRHAGGRRCISTCSRAAASTAPTTAALGDPGRTCPAARPATPAMRFLISQMPILWLTPTGPSACVRPTKPVTLLLRPSWQPTSALRKTSNTLFRFSKGHGGLACESCHGSTHAIWPNDDPAANDNIAATQLQGHDGTIIECGTCHGQGSLPLTTNGPHGLHNVNDARWVDESHGDFYERDKDGCKACHGLDLMGTPLAKTAAARSFRVEDNTVTFAKGDLVSCNRCHGIPSTLMAI